MKNSSSLEAKSSHVQWRRVSPISMAYFAFDLLKHSINLWPALVGVWAGGQVVQELFWDYGIYLLALGFLAMIFLDYWFFRFQEEADRIQLQRGVFNRKRLTLYYDRVQQADISQPYYFRPFGLSVLGLESAGSAQKEVDLPGLPFVEAERLKTRILEYKGSSDATLVASEGDATELRQMAPEYELRLPPAELARYGLMHNGLLFLLPLSAPFWQYFDVYVDRLEPYFRDSALHVFLLEITQGRATLLVGLSVVLSVIAGLVSLFALSVIIGLVRFWGYHLTGGRDQYQYRAGLLTIRTRGFRLHKLQKVTVEQGLVANWLKRYTLSISKAGGFSPQQQSQDGRHFMIPVLNGDILAEIAARLGLPEPVWTRVSPFQYVWRGSLKGLFFAAVTTILVDSLAESIAAGLMAGLAVFAVFLLAARRYWRRFGYFHDENWLVVKSGFIGQTLTFIPVVKIQKIQVSQPPWLRWRGLAHLLVWSGDGRVRVPYVPYGTSTAIRNELLNRVATFHGRWF